MTAAPGVFSARKTLDLSLYLVADVAACAPRGVLATVREAVAGGVTIVQLRDFSCCDRELHEQVVAVRTLLAGTGVPVLVDDRVEVAVSSGADGVHLEYCALPADEVRERLGPHAVVGMSAGMFGQRAGAGGEPCPVDYLAVGPVLATRTKADAGAPIGVEGVAAACAAATLPCVAVGGVTAAVAGALAGAGAAGIAVVGAICRSADPLAAARELRASFDG